MDEVVPPYAPCPIPHGQKLHPLVGGVFYYYDLYLIAIKSAVSVNRY
jgi:hypothetical protein